MVVKTKSKDIFNYDDDVYKQISLIEKENAKTSTRLDNIENALVSIQRVITDIRDGTRTNWGVLASWATVIFAVMIYHSSLTVEPMRKELFRIRDFKDTMESTIPALEVQVEYLRERIDDKASHRYPRQEAEKDIRLIHERIKVLETQNARSVME